MSEQIFEELKKRIASSRPDWLLERRGDGNYSLANKKVFAYFDYTKTGIIIRARVFPNSIHIQEYKEIFTLSPRVNKVGSWKDEIIDIHLKQNDLIENYFNLLQSIADKKPYKMDSIKEKEASNITYSSITTETGYFIGNLINNNIIQPAKGMLDSILGSTNPIDNKNPIDNENINKIIEDEKKPQLLEITKKVVSEEEISYKVSNLIYPFSNIYYMTYEVHNNTKDRFESMLKAVEFISAFNSIVLLSVLEKNQATTIFEEVFSVKGIREVKISFGKWLDLYRTTSDFLIKNKDLDTLPFGSDFYKSITDKNIFREIAKVVEKRNKASHGGIISESQAQKELNEIEPIFKTLFTKLLTYENILLLAPISMKKNNGIYTTNCTKLNGNNYPFSKTNIDSKNDFDTDLLYLYNSKTDDRLKLYSEFVKLEICAHCNQQSFYILSKYGKDTSVYSSIHNPTHDFKVNTDGILLTILSN